MQPVMLGQGGVTDAVVFTQLFTTVARAARCFSVINAPQLYLVFQEELKPCEPCSPVGL
jgi:hypothetical protein